MLPRAELLLPAGSLVKLKTAILYGADAVYAGTPDMCLRAQSKFSLPELEEGIKFVHNHGKKIYLTLNLFMHNRDVEKLPTFVETLQRLKPDGVLIADPGVFQFVKEHAPELNLFVSTQANICSWQAVKFWQAQGAKLCVLGREVTFEEACEIRQKCPDILLETFMHGAMCMSFSGRCVLSNYLAGRDANRGECAQPCRWNYYLMEEKRPGEFFPIFEEEDGTYILNAKDLCMIEYLDQLADAGVGSFKIEGRAKSFYYVATITNAYRCAVELLEKDPAHYRLPGWLLEETKKVSHRQYSTGFYFGQPDNGQYYESGGYIRNYDVAAVVEGWEEGMLLCTQRNRFFPGETLEVLLPGKSPELFPVPAIFDTDGQSLEAARHPMQQLRIPCTGPIAKGTILRRQQK